MEQAEEAGDEQIPAADGGQAVGDKCLQEPAEEQFLQQRNEQKDLQIAEAEGEETTVEWIPLSEAHGQAGRDSDDREQREIYRCCADGLH